MSGKISSDRIDCPVCNKPTEVLWRLEQVEYSTRTAHKELSEVDDKIMKARTDFYASISNIKNMLIVTTTSACLSLLGIVAILISRS